MGDHLHLMGEFDDDYPDLCEVCKEYVKTGGDSDCPRCKDGPFCSIHINPLEHDCWDMPDEGDQD